MNQYDGCSFFAHMVNRELLSIGSDIRIHVFDRKFKNDRIIDILKNDFRRKNRPIPENSKFIKLLEGYCKKANDRERRKDER